MTLTTASMDLKDDQARIKKTKLKSLPCPKRAHLNELITTKYKNQLDCYSILFLFFRSPSHGGSLTLYSSLWIILTLHMFIIWALTQVLFPSDTLFDFWWVVVAKVALFRGLLHINAAKKVAAIHLMWWQQLSLKYSWISFLLVCSWGTSPPLELLGGSFWLLE